MMHPIYNDETDDEDGEDQNMDPNEPPLQLIIPPELLLPPHDSNDGAMNGNEGATHESILTQGADYRQDDAVANAQVFAPGLTLLHVLYLLPDGISRLPVTSCVPTQYADYFANQTLVPLAIVERMELRVLPDRGVEQG
jgi:hypothetical protein